MDDKVEKDKRISKNECGSRQGCFIETSLLEKRSILDHAKITEEENVHAMSDLTVCPDRQTPDSCGLVEETIGANRKAIQLIKKDFLDQSIIQEQLMELVKKSIEVRMKCQEKEHDETCSQEQHAQMFHAMCLEYQRKRSQA